MIIVAIADDFYDDYPGATASPDFQKSRLPPDDPPNVTVGTTDRCVGCSTYDLDFSPAAFKSLVGSDWDQIGRIHSMSWSLISTAITSSMTTSTSTPASTTTSVSSVTTTTAIATSATPASTRSSSAPTATPSSSGPSCSWVDAWDASVSYCELPFGGNPLHAVTTSGPPSGGRRLTFQATFPMCGKMMAFAKGDGPVVSCLDGL